MAYQILLTRAAEKGLDALPRPLFLRVKRELLALAENPYPVDRKGLKGKHKGLHGSALGITASSTKSKQQSLSSWW